MNAAQRKRSAQKAIHDLTEAALKCKAFGHQWEEDPGADWHTPRFEYIHTYRFYFRCVRGCGSVKMGTYTQDGRWVTGYSRPPAANRIIGLGRGVGRKPFIQEYIERAQKTPTGRRKVSDKSRRRSA
jgi:hypothetical protein